jgi:ApaG protein
MYSKISGGITVQVETSFQEDYSNPMNNEYVFAYKITIHNQNDFPVKLLRRHWHIYDGNGQVREVEGEGVVGVQPVIAPGKKYQYISGCNLKSDIGKMHGIYVVENLNNRKQFNVIIPAFYMTAPFKLN